MPALSQIALSVGRLERSVDWYRQVLGMRPTGSTALFRGPVMGKVTGIPGPVSRCAWLVDCQRRFQLELFEFSRPEPRRRKPVPEPGRIGYRSMVVRVDDFDLVLRSNGAPVAVEGQPGGRRAILHDPDGNPVEVTEADPREPGRCRQRSGIPCAVRGVVASVPDIDRTRRFFGDALGLREAGGPFRRTAFWADDIAIEFDHCPNAEPWPDDYRLSDIGFLNVAFAWPGRAGFRHAANRIRRSGYRLVSRPVDLRLGGVVYAEDDQGFSVELGYQSRFAATRLGFLE